MVNTEEFLKSIAGRSVKILSPDPQQGPEGFPYMLVSTEAAGEPFANIAKWCSEKGIGVVVNPQKPDPDFLFTYGMLWNFVERGEFLSGPLAKTIAKTATKAESKKIELSQGQQLFAGNASESFWPSYARKIFKEFLLQQGFMQGRFVLLAERAEGPFDVVFSLESLGQPREAEWQGVLQAFSWFFPSHYSLALLSEKSITGTNFYNI